MSKDKEIKEEMNSSDYLNKYLEQTDVSASKEESSSSDSPTKEPEKVMIKGSVDKNYNFIEFTKDILPLSMFYEEGTKILIRKAEIKEIQAFSMVNNQFFYDVIDKMNSMIASCVRIKKPNGEITSYLDLKDGDRYFIIFLIRELTFGKSNQYFRSFACDCGEEVKIEMSKENFEFFEMNEEIVDFFDEEEKAFVFETVNGDVFKLAPPNIGIQKSFSDYIMDEIRNKREPNLSFLKIIPFTIVNRNNITEDGIKKKLKDFQNSDIINEDSFQFLNGAVNKMLFGIRYFKKTCSCGVELKKEFSLPNKISELFVEEDGFNKFIKRK